MPIKKKAKRIAPKMTYNVSRVEDYLHYANTDQTQDLFFKLALDTIQFGVMENKDIADMVTLAGEKDNTVISLKRSEWKPILKKAITFYSKLNQFEKCIDCQQLLNVLK
jgi:hypothetical protein